MRKAKPEPEITGSMDGMAPYHPNDGFEDFPSVQVGHPGFGRMGEDNRPHYRGPMPGQTVMGVDRLHEGKVGRRDPFGDPPERHYEVDPHGFVHEGYTAQGHDLRGAVNGNRTGIGAASLYGSHGGRFSSTMRESLDGESPSDLGMSHEDVVEHDRRVRQVRAHWKQQPLVQMPTTALIHTQQDYADTEGDDTGAGREGRLRIEAVREDVERGAKIRKPAWIAKVNGRHFALDGHHRIVAAREGGAETFPARVWDIDGENAAHTRSVDKLPEHVRMKMRRMVDRGHLLPEEIHPKWRSDVMR